MWINGTGARHNLTAQKARQNTKLQRSRAKIEMEVTDHQRELQTQWCEASSSNQTVLIWSLPRGYLSMLGRRTKNRFSFGIVFNQNVRWKEYRIGLNKWLHESWHQHTKSPREIKFLEMGKGIRGEGGEEGKGM